MMGVMKYFTVEEANALLPKVRALVEEMFVIRQAALARRPDLQPVIESAVGNGGSRKAGELLEIFEQFEQVVGEIRQLGCELKGLEQGLVDFPAMRHGRQVYLCWQYNEPEVAFWHDVDAGFAGRQPL
jgi:hypothetical protein